MSGILRQLKKLAPFGNMVGEVVWELSGGEGVGRLMGEALGEHVGRAVWERMGEGVAER